MIQQVSHSKKWKSQQVTDEQGRTSLVPSYRILQDEFFRHMQEAGFTDFIRGERGSDAQHLSCLEYQIQQSATRLKEIQKSIEENTVQERIAKEVYKTYSEIESMGKRTITGKVTISKEDFDLLTGLAKEGIASRGQIYRLKSDSQILHQRSWKLQENLDDLEKQIRDLTIRCHSYLQASQAEPEKVEAFLDGILY